MKKIFFLLMMALSTLSIDSNAQTATINVGSSRLFTLPYLDLDYTYAGEMYHQTGSSLGGYTYYFSSVNIVSNKTNWPTTNYHSSHGNYILFKYKCKETGFTTFTEQVIFSKTIGNSQGYHAFVKEGNKLHIVNVQTDEIVSTLDYNITDGFLDILVLDKKPHQSGYLTIFVSHNDYLKIYDELPAPSRVDNVPAEAINSAKKYNLEGIEIESNTEGVYIQDGKKIIKKK